MAKSFGSHAFSYFAPEVWNKLPTIVSHAPSISVFCKHLKTHYFTHPPNVALLSPWLSLLDLTHFLPGLRFWTLFGSVVALLSRFFRIKASLKFFIHSYHLTVYLLPLPLHNYKHVWVISKAWMGSNKLKINPDKTEFILFGSKQQHDSLKHCFPVAIY